MNEKSNNVLKMLSYFWNTIFVLIVGVVFLISCIIIVKSITNPYKIPDIFSYKPFIILDENMDSSVYYGDLAITKIVDTNTLKSGDIVAFRNNNNYITIHKIAEITETNNTKTFKLVTKENEDNSTKYTTEESIEGILVKRIPNVGIGLLFIQEPFGLLFIITIVLIIGVIAYYIAERMDNNEKLTSI